jgi:SAM-dependent methyltransferase
MKNARQRTIHFYDQHAHVLRDHYADIGSRDGDVALGFSLAGGPEAARVLEIGCGYGREAAEILRWTPFYTGIDGSEAFIKLARAYVPEGRFVQADAVEYDYPGRYNIVFSFAALRHLDRTDIQIVLTKVLQSLRPNGVLYISLNYGRVYMEHIKEDSLGKRTIYLYNPALIAELAGPGYRTIYQTRNTVGDAEWFEVALQVS